MFAQTHVSRSFPCGSCHLSHCCYLWSAGSLWHPPSCPCGNIGAFVGCSKRPAYGGLLLGVKLEGSPKILGQRSSLACLCLELLEVNALTQYVHPHRHSLTVFAPTSSNSCQNESNYHPGTDSEAKTPFLCPSWTSGLILAGDYGKCS